MKKLLNFLSTALLFCVLGVPLLAFVVLAVVAPSAHTIIVALIAVSVAAIAWLIYRGVMSSRAKRAPEVNA